MNLFPTVFISAIVFTILWASTVSLCQRYQQCRQMLPFFLIIALAWWSMPLAKIFWLDEVFPPADAIGHEAMARDTASLLDHGNVNDALADVRPGNSGYRFALGVFYFLTRSPEYCTYLLNGMLVFLGSLVLLQALMSCAPLARVSLWMVLLLTATPSALFWTTTNLKEGAMFWCGSVLLATSLRREKSTPKMIFLDGLAMMTGLAFRPHIAAGWISAIGIHAFLRDRRFGRALLLVLALAGATQILQIASPTLFEGLVSDGATETMDNFYTTRTNIGGSAIAYAGGSPTPIVSGFILLLARPLPTELFGSLDLLAGIEIWIISGIALFSILRHPNPLSLLKEPPIMVSLIALVFFSIFFTGMYNMGLMVRQRVQILPALLTLAVYPTLSARAFCRALADQRQRRGAQPRLNISTELAPGFLQKPLSHK